MSAYLLKFKDVKSEVSLENMESDHSINFELKHGEIGVILGQKEAHQIFQLILKKENLKQGEIKFSDASLQKEWNKAEDIEWRQKIGFTFMEDFCLT